jgi:hypothetical protein
MNANEVGSYGSSYSRVLGVGSRGSSELTCLCCLLNLSSAERTNNLACDPSPTGVIRVWDVVFGLMWLTLSGTAGSLAALLSRRTAAVWLRWGRQCLKSVAPATVQLLLKFDSRSRLSWSCVRNRCNRSALSCTGRDECCAILKGSPAGRFSICSGLGAFGTSGNTGLYLRQVRNNKTLPVCVILPN